MVSFEDFKKMDIRIAEIKEVKDHPDADKLYLLKIDTGTDERQIVAGIKKHYKPDDLLGKKIVVVVNLEPVTIRGAESSGMLLAAKDGGNLCLIAPEKEITLGSKIS